VAVLRANAPVERLSSLTPTMGFRHISKDIKDVALRLIVEGHVPNDVARLLGVSMPSIRRWRRNFRRFGTVVAPCRRLRGRPRLLHPDGTHDLVLLYKEAPYLYLSEVQEWLAIAHDVGMSQATLSRYLRDAGLTLKRLRRAANERDEEERQRFREDVQAHLLASQVVCVDETSKDNRTLYRVHGRAPSGERAVLRAPFHRGVRYSGVAALGLDGYLACRIVPGSVDGWEFFDFIVEDVVRGRLCDVSYHAHNDLQLPRMNPFPAERSVLILDNCAIHKHDLLRELVEGYGMFLPLLRLLLSCTARVSNHLPTTLLTRHEPDRGELQCP
jgi:transposase